MARALSEGDPAVVRALLDAGGRLDYGRANGYDALIEAREIRVSGGKIAAPIDGEEAHVENERRLVLDLDRLAWRFAM
jgi:hypothetical protein